MTLPDPLDGEPPTLPAVSWRDPLETSSASARPSLLQEALLTAPSRAASAFETHISHWIDSLARRDWQATRLWLMSQAASAHVALLALWKSLARGDRPAPSASPSEPAPRRAVDSERSAPLEPRPPVGVSPGVRVRAEKGKDSLGVYSPRRSTDDGLPILQLEPLDDEEALEIILEPVDDEVPKSVPSKLSKLDDRASAPLPIRQLPVLRPVALPRPKQVRDAHAGERLHLSGSPWTKRLVVLSCLAAGGLFAALTSETWVPKAVPGRLVVSKIDRPKQSRDEAERRRQAQQEARQRLPHLAPETIRLVLAKNATGVLDPPAVFQVTCDAVDRGSWALTPDEAQELRALRRELLDALLPSEAERVLEYDGARARRATLPFENRAALDLFARGARALPSRSRARLQVLFGKAVAAHLRAEGAPRL